MEDGGRDPSRPISEEAAKKNTDCVYFLASPLTCKKGNECEYRHSEGARVNPRDCWFWLNGNCLNPKCSFRHPPLDGFSGAPVTTPGSTLPSTQTAMPSPASHAPAAHTSSKQSIPCYYFQKGGCLKGERCPFMHDVPPSNSPSMQPTAKVNTEVTEPTSSLKSTSWVLENYAHHDIHKTSDKPVEVSRTSTKMNVKAETVLTSGISGKSSIMPSPLSNVTFHILPPPNVPSNTSAVSVRPEGHHLEPLNEHVQNGREADESLRESSPGFDVLVDDECEDTNYFHVDDRDPSSHEVDNPNVTNDFDYHSSVYNSMAQFEREPHRTHNEVSEYDRRGRHDRYRQDDCRYSGRNKDRLSIQEGRTSCREDCSNEIYGSDLRHQLLKKRKVNGLRSAINTDHHGEPYQKEKDDQYAEKQRYLSRNSGRDQHRFSHESSISKRLQGRITLTGEPPSDNPRNMHSEKERERGKDWARSSAGQPLNYQGRLHDRSITSMHEAGSLEGQLRRDEMGPLNFAGPKSLAEIKGTKFSNDTKDRLSKASNSTITHEQKSLILNKALGPHESEGSLSFEGPKPLSEILKRKREAAPGNDDTSSNGHGNNHNIIVEDHAGGSMVMPITDSQDVCLLESQNRGCPAASETEGPNSTAVEEEGPGMTDGEQLPQIDQSSAKKEVLEGEDRLADNIEDPENGAYDPRDGGFEYAIEEGTDFQKEDNEELSLLDQSSHKEEVLEPEDGMLVDNMEDSEDNYDQRDEEVEYDEVEDTDFRTYDENDQKDENDVDDEDDDDDDFARKIGVMFS